LRYEARTGENMNVKDFVVKKSNSIRKQYKKGKAIPVAGHEGI
jgi:hypothetical protein